MREIEFRGKKGNSKEWLYGDLSYGGPENNHKKFASINIWEDGLKTGYVVKQETIGQYTGLKDKNGKKIYDGDIVKVFISGRWWIAKVIYEYSGFTIDVTNNKELEFGRRGIIERFTEVIGNIYDNPELLKEEI